MASRQKMQAEIMVVNKKNNIHPLGALASTFITLPFFYSMYRVFSALRGFKDGYIFTREYKLIYSPFTAVFHHQFYIYLIFAFILIPIQIISFKLPSFLARVGQTHVFLNEAAKKEYKRTRTITNVVAVVFAVMAFELPLSIGIYWIFSGLYTIIQTLLVFNYQQKKKNPDFKLFDRKKMRRYFKEKFADIKSIRPPKINIPFLKRIGHVYAYNFI